MVSSWPSCMTSTRRLAKRRSSRSRTTWNSRSFSGSPPAMKCAEIVLGGSFSDTVRLPATNDCAIIWPPNVRTGFLLGCEPTKVSSAI